MSKIMSASILGLIASVSLASCSGGGSNSSSSTDGNKLTGDGQNNPHEIVKESCFDILNTKTSQESEKVVDILKNTKTTLCRNIEDRLNKGEKAVNAYSSMWNANIQLASNPKTQDSFYQTLEDGTFMPLWGVAQWINNDDTFLNNSNPKILAFGEAKASLEATSEFDFDVFGNVQKKKWGIWDIRFIDSKGKIWKANEDGGHGYLVKMAKYAVEAELPEEYINSVYSTFALPESGEVVFLRKVTQKADPNVEGSVDTFEYIYDVKKFNEETKAYDEVSSNGKTSDLFSMIPTEDIASIDYIQKLPGNQFSLYKKSAEGSNYLGYYLISSNDLKNKDASVTFVAAITDFQKFCNPESTDKKCVFVNENTSNSFDSGNVALEASKGSVAYIIPQQENASGPTSLVWGNGSSYAGKTSDIIVSLVNNETGEKEQVTLSGKRLLHIDGMANIMNSAHTSYDPRVGSLIISFNKEKNPELKAGHYTGEFTVQAKGWHDKNFSKDIKVLVSIEQKAASEVKNK